MTARAVQAIGYARVSTDQQRDSGLGLDAQHISIREAVARLGAPLVSVHVVAGFSGTLFLDHRPGLAEALNALPRGARILSAAGEGTDTDDPSAVFTRRILDAVAELERGPTTARTRAALRAKRARGERTGTEPYGFRVNGDGRTLHLYAPEQEILTGISSARVERQSLRAIAADLNLAGLTTRTGAPFRHQNIASILATVARHSAGASR